MESSLKCVKVLLLVCGLFLGIVACGSTEGAGTTKREELAVGGIKSLVKLKNGLYYDEENLIVYYWNGISGVNGATTPTPYYGENGRKCKYNPETNTVTEMECRCEQCQ